MVAGIISVFAVAFLSLWGAIPVGLALELSPVVVAVTAAASYAAGVALVLVLGQPVRDWLLRRFGDKISSNPNSPVRRAWDRYGMIGLALLAPVTTGSQVGAVIALSFNTPPRRVFLTMTAGAILWSAALTAVFTLGLLGARSIR